MPKIAPNSPLYAQFRADFPAQAGEGITADLNYSDTIVPIVDMTNAAGEGTLAPNLQTAIDFATSHDQVDTTSTVLINTPGFWRIWGFFGYRGPSTVSSTGTIRLSDG